jgi:hypothetical protein
VCFVRQLAIEPPKTHHSPICLKAHFYIFQMLEVHFANYIQSLSFFGERFKGRNLLIASQHERACCAKHTTDAQSQAGVHNSGLGGGAALDLADTLKNCEHPIHAGMRI